MSKFLMIVGILCAALGIVTGLLVFFSSAQMQIIGITPLVAVNFLLGGFVLMGLGGVVEAIRSGGGTAAAEMRDRLARIESEAPMPMPAPRSGATAATAAAAAAAGAAAAVASHPSRIPSPVPSAAEAAGKVFEPIRSRAEEATASIKSDAEQMIAEARRAAAETSAALDKAKAELEEALAPEEITVPPGAEITSEEYHVEEEVVEEPAAEEITVSEPEVIEEEVAAVEEEPEPELEPAPIEEEEATEDQLYVVEERMIRGRPARVLSDGTVEAETDEGWMRFENLDHLEEYLDAMSPPRA